MKRAAEGGRRGPSSLSGRVALATAVASAAAGLVVAGVVLVLDAALFGAREEGRLREAANTLSVELEEPDADIAWVIDDETRELAGTGIDIAVFDGDERLGGDPRVGRAPHGCTASLGRRTCEVVGERAIAVASRVDASEREQRSALMLALAIAVVVATLLSAILGWAVAGWSLRPLRQLTERVAAVGEQGAVELGPRRGIDEVDALREVLQRTLDRLRVSLGHSQRFAGDAAHELRTPLTALAGELELLAERPRDPEDADSVARARRTVARLVLLVERLLVLATPTRDGHGLESVPLGERIEELVAELPRVQRERMSLDLPAVLPPVTGDGSLLAAMVSCGVENALKFSSGPVVVRLSVRDEALVLQIDDEGPGVPSAERERVFLAFERAGSAVQGHGIGLALVAHVAALHRGRAAFVEGAVGARLEIILPLG